MRPLVLIAFAPLAACAPAVGRAPPDRVPQAEVTGPALSCLTTTQINDTRVHDDRTIDFHTSGGQVYRNTLPYGCSELGFEQRFAYTLSIPRLCSTDIITVLHSDGTRGASCGLGEFVPIAAEPRR